MIVTSICIVLVLCIVLGWKEVDIAAKNLKGKKINTSILVKMWYSKV